MPWNRVSGIIVIGLIYLFFLPKKLIHLSFLFAKKPPSKLLLDFQIQVSEMDNDPLYFYNQISSEMILCFFSLNSGRADLDYSDPYFI